MRQMSLAKVHQHRQFGAQLRDGGERRAGVVGEEQPRRDGQVSGRRHRQELREPLDQGTARPPAARTSGATMVFASSAALSTPKNITEGCLRIRLRAVKVAVAEAN